MKFYNRMLIAVMIFQTFSSACMDKASLPQLRSSELLLLPSVYKNEVKLYKDRTELYTNRLSEILLVEQHTRIVEIELHSELNKQIGPKRLNVDKEGFLKSAIPETFQEFFLTIPEDTQKYFLPTYFIAQNEQKIAQSLAKKKEEQAAQMALVNAVLEREAAVTKLTEENIALRAQSQEREKNLVAQKKEIKLEKQKIDQAKKTASPQLPAPQKIKKNNPSLSLRENRNAMKSLMSHFKARETLQLNMKLQDLCDNIWYARVQNDRLEGPYFDSTRHLLCGKINTHWSYIFYPCTSKLYTTNNSYITTISTIETFLNHDFICDKKCNHYVSKCKKIEPYSSTESSDMEMCSESD